MTGKCKPPIGITSIATVPRRSTTWCREYGENIPSRNLHLLMGTMASHMRTFIVIGLLRCAFDPQELARGRQLF